jgi:4-hydroxy-2-oxoheptanedioate aldolase
LRSPADQEPIAEDRLRRAALDGRTLFCAWLTVNSPLLVELIEQAGWDFILIDQQHGLGGHDAMVACLTAAKAAGMPALVRVANNDPGLIGRALDAGAQGVVCPLINSAEDAERFVRAVKYPPQGTRSWGPYRAQFNLSGDYIAQANAWTIACPQIETKGALDKLDDILSIDGVDMVCFGPNDLSAALTGRFDIRAREVTDAMMLVLDKCLEKAVMSFVFANDIDYAKPLLKGGWDVLAIGTDASWFSAAAAEVLSSLTIA